MGQLTRGDNVKSLILALAVSLSCSAAIADGFVCSDSERTLEVKVYNYNRPEFGTRNAAVMTLADPRVSEGRKTIAVFRGANGVLTNSASTYISYVDMRVEESSRGGELIAGTKLGYVYSIILAVDFSYNFPVKHGAKMAGELILVKQNGEKIYLSLECSRYLKGRNNINLVTRWHL